MLEHQSVPLEIVLFGCPDSLEKSQKRVCQGAFFAVWGIKE
jgi:hypothetical protein